MTHCSCSLIGMSSPVVTSGAAVVSAAAVVVVSAAVVPVASVVAVLPAVVVPAPSPPQRRQDHGEHDKQVPDGLHGFSLQTQWQLSGAQDAARRHVRGVFRLPPSPTSDFRLIPAATDARG